jgi:hypothetical protein
VTAPAAYGSTDALGTTMIDLTTLKNLIPDHAKNLKLNIASVLSHDGVGA